MSEETGFQIGNRVYPFPERFRLGDPVLVEQLTGLTWMQFVDRLPDEDDPSRPDDPVANLGMIGVSVSQANPDWRRDKVIRFTLAVHMDDVSVVGPEPEEESADPLAATNGSPTSETSASESGSDSGSPQEPSSQKPSGAPA